MSRRRALRVVPGEACLLPRIQALKAEHPVWGDRRIWAYRRFVEQRPVHKKRGLRLRREHHLLVSPNVQLKAKRTPRRSQPKPPKPNEWWGIAMTKVVVEGLGWVSSVVVLDWDTTAMVGYHARLHCRAQQWRAALDRAVNRQFPDGARAKGLSLMRDNGGHPTSVAFMQAGHTLGSQQAFTSDHNPKGNADTERVRRTLKEECLWLREGTCPLELTRALHVWITESNEHDLHSALGYKPPRQFEREYHLSHGTQFTAA
jgi:putative transposase